MHGEAGRRQVSSPACFRRDRVLIMKYTKQVIAQMPKCYAVGMFDGSDASSFLAAVEKEGPIRRFALDGTPMETVAKGPGGIMTIAQVPRRNDQFLATRKFFSPNFGGADAAIASYTHEAHDAWTERTLCDLPYVHRFGLLEGTDGTLWLLACTIKGTAETGVKDDWRVPGAVWAAPLNGQLEQYDDKNQLELTCIASCQVQNHGFWTAPDKSFALISTAAGVFRYVPPASPEGEWDITCLIIQPTSDIVVADLDGDGANEILTFSKFHGDTLSIWHETEIKDRYELVWTDPSKREFLHALWAGDIAGKRVAIIGHRKEARDLLLVHYTDGTYHVDVIDHDLGPANVWAYNDGTNDRIIAAYRETDQLALYTVKA